MILDFPLQFHEGSRLQSETMLPTRTERTCAVLARFLNFNRLLIEFYYTNKYKIK